VFAHSISIPIDFTCSSAILIAAAMTFYRIATVCALMQRENAIDCPTHSNKLMMHTQNYYSDRSRHRGKNKIKMLQFTESSALPHGLNFKNRSAIEKSAKGNGGWPAHAVHENSRHQKRR
jgi:hypothetical protein